MRGSQVIGIAGGTVAEQLGINPRGNQVVEIAFYVDERLDVFQQVGDLVHVRQPGSRPSTEDGAPILERQAFPAAGPESGAKPRRLARTAERDLATGTPIRVL